MGWSATVMVLCVALAFIAAPQGPIRAPAPPTNPYASAPPNPVSSLPTPAAAATQYGLLRITAPAGLIFAKAIPQPGQWAQPGYLPFRVVAPGAGLNRRRVELTGQLLQTAPGVFRVSGMCTYETKALVAKTWVTEKHPTPFSGALVAGRLSIPVCSGALLAVRMPPAP